MAHHMQHITKWLKLASSCQGNSRYRKDQRAKREVGNIYNTKRHSWSPAKIRVKFEGKDQMFDSLHL